MNDERPSVPSDEQQGLVSGEPVAWDDVRAERLRQISAEGWTTEHDDEHVSGEIANAAADWLMTGQRPSVGWARNKATKPRRRQLVIGAALALAEIERLDRATPAVQVSADGSDLLTVAHIESDDGVGTLTLEFSQLGDLASMVGEDEATYTVRIASMKRADFEALGEFDGF